MQKFFLGLGVLFFTGLIGYKVSMAVLEKTIYKDVNSATVIGVDTR